MPKNVTADLEVDVTAPVEQPPKRAKTLRLSLKSKDSVDDAVETTEPELADVVAVEAPVAVIAEAPEPGPVLSPAERREAILRKLREEGDTTVPPRREPGDGAAPPAFRYPVNRFAR